MYIFSKTLLIIFNKSIKSKLIYLFLQLPLFDFLQISCSTQAFVSTFFILFFLHMKYPKGEKTIDDSYALGHENYTKNIANASS